MSRRLAVLAAMLVAITAFAWANIPVGVGVEVLTGPNSVMHTKALPNDSASHDPYLGWSGTVDSDVIRAGQTVIKKGWLVKGRWGGQRASSRFPGHLLVQLDTVNGEPVNGHAWKDSGVRGQDTWVAAGSVIPFYTCNPGPCMWMVIR